MKIWVLTYVYNAVTSNFNTIAKDETKVEVFTKKSELWERIEHLEEADSIYYSYSDIVFHEVDITELSNRGVIKTEKVRS